PWLALCVFLLVLFALDLIGVETRSTIVSDRSLERSVHTLFGRSTFAVFQFFSFIGGGLIRTVITIAAFLALAVVRRWWTAMFYALTAVASLLVEIVKDLVRRPRPHLFPGALHASGFSFPSGHSTSSVVFFGGLAFIVWQLSRRSGWATAAVIIAALFAAAVGLSRIVLGVHYPTDVFGGYTLGGAWLTLLLAVLLPRVPLRG
ncbi:MAG: phosphatase PAP2 family protein, partial [Chloroflexota bacterium]